MPQQALELVAPARSTSAAYLPGRFLPKILPALEPRSRLSTMLASWLRAGPAMLKPTCGQPPDLSHRTWVRTRGRARARAPHGCSARGVPGTACRPSAGPCRVSRTRVPAQRLTQVMCGAEPLLAHVLHATESQEACCRGCVRTQPTTGRKRVAMIATRLSPARPRQARCVRRFVRATRVRSRSHEGPEQPV